MTKQEKARLEARALWVKACRFDGIPTDAKFVCLSKDNPYDKPYNKAVEKYMHVKMLNNSIPVW